MGSTAGTSAGGGASYSGAAGAALSTYGAVSSAYAAKNAADAQKYALEYQGAVAQNNAVYAEMQATDALQRGAASEQKSRLQVASLKGTQRSSLAARGIALDEGSALNILSDTDFMGERDVRTIQDNAAREAWGYRQQAVNYRNNGGLLNSGAGQVDSNAAFANTLISGAGKVASSWYSYKNAGAK